MKSNRVVLFLAVSIVVLGLGYGGFSYYRANRFYFAPRNESNLFALGQIEASKGQHDKAIKVYQELLTKDSKHSIAMRFMIESMMKIDDRSQVFPTLDRLIEIDPSKENFEFAASVSLEMKDKSKYDEFLKKAKTQTK